MAKTVLSTPELSNSEANFFVEQMMVAESRELTSYQKAILVDIKSNRKSFSVSNQ